MTLEIQRNHSKCIHTMEGSLSNTTKHVQQASLSIFDVPVIRVGFHAVFMCIFLFVHKKVEIHKTFFPPNNTNVFWPTAYGRNTLICYGPAVISKDKSFLSTSVDWMYDSYTHFPHISIKCINRPGFILSYNTDNQIKCW